MTEGSSLMLAPPAALAVAETSSTAMAAQARALTEAKFTVALARPRDVDDVRQRILRACERPRFAETARYTLTWLKDAAGNHVTGPSIRFAEELARSMRNLDITQRVLFDDSERRVVRVTVMDLESVLSYESDITITKVSEKSKLREGQLAIGTRTNAEGKTVYLVEATEQDLAAKQNALASKAMRTGILRICPSDIVEDAMAEVRATVRRRDAADPDAARKSIADAFASIAVMPTDLKVYLGHELSQCSPAQLEDLRLIYAAISQGEARWLDFVKAKEAKDAAEAKGEEAPKTKVDNIKDNLKKQREQRAQQAAAQGANPATGEVPPREPGQGG
jgi:hypothetical protein